MKYYGRYSNKSRGQRAKTPAPAPSGCAPVSDRARSTTAGLADHRSPVTDAQSPITHRRIPSRSWRELIKKVWDADPLLCPKCGGEMKLIALIEQKGVIEDILRHLGLWQEQCRPSGLAPPEVLRLEYTYDSFHDDLPFGSDSFAE